MVLNTCIHCNYTTNRRYRFDAHLTSRRHLELLQQSTLQEPTKRYYDCLNCKKRYISKSGLWNHKQHCLPIQPPPMRAPPVSFDTSLNMILSQHITNHVQLIEQLQTELESIVAAPAKNHTIMNVVYVNNRVGGTGGPEETYTPLEVSRRDFENILITPIPPRTNQT